MKTKQRHAQSLNLAVVFLIAFVSLILLSVTLKTINVFRNSRFDGKNHFTLSVRSKDNILALLSLSPKDNTIYILAIKDDTKKNIATTLEIPIEGTILSTVSINQKNIKTIFFNQLMSLNTKSTNLNRVDLLRLWLYVNSVSLNSVYQQEISAIDDPVRLRSLGIYSYFVDPQIAEEKKTIEIINGTSVPGLGNRLASLLSNMGANVVMVSNSEQEEKYSVIKYTNSDSYTLKKLTQTLRFKKELVKKNRLGEITIIIGEDGIEKIGF